MSRGFVHWHRFNVYRDRIKFTASNSWLIGAATPATETRATRQNNHRDCVTVQCLLGINQLIKLIISACSATINSDLDFIQSKHWASTIRQPIFTWTLSVALSVTKEFLSSSWSLILTVLITLSIDTSGCGYVVRQFVITIRNCCLHSLHACWSSLHKIELNSQFLFDSIAVGKISRKTLIDCAKLLLGVPQLSTQNWVRSEREIKSNRKHLLSKVISMEEIREWWHAAGCNGMKDRSELKAELSNDPIVEESLWKVQNSSHGQVRQQWRIVPQVMTARTVRERNARDDCGRRLSSICFRSRITY